MREFFIGICVVLSVAIIGCSKSAVPQVAFEGSTIPVPVITSVSYKDSLATIDWTVPNTVDVAYFELYVKAPNSPWYSTPIVISPNALSYSSDDLFPDGVGNYSFVLSAVNNKNEQGRSSNIYKYNFEGFRVSLGIWDDLGLKGPQSIAVSASKRVFVADTNNHRVSEVTDTGSLIDVFGSKGSGNGQFFSPMGLVVDSKGYVVVADSNNDRIVRFNPDDFLNTFSTLGKEVSSKPEPGTALGQFNFPVSCTLGPSEEIYVSDLNNSRIQKVVLANDSNFSGATGTAFGTYLAREIVSSATRLYILTNTNHLIVSSFGGSEILDIDLVAKTINSEATNFRGIAFDEANQEIYVSSEDAHKIFLFSLTGVLKNSFGSKGKNSGNLDKPAGLCLRDEILYVTESGNNRVQVFR